MTNDEIAGLLDKRKEIISMPRLSVIAAAFAYLAVAVLVAGCPQQQSPASQGPAGPIGVSKPAPTPAESPPSGETNCSLCGRSCEPNRLITVETPGEDYTFCCPVCLARYIKQGKIDPGQATVTAQDFLTGESVSLDEMVVVVDSDVVCPAGQSAVVLSSQQNADEFIADHGGAQMPWKEFLAAQSEQ